MASPKLTRGAATTVGVGVRLFAVAAAVAWGIFYFGVIDLLVVPIQDETFYDFYLIETGWGLLYTVLVAVPLVMFAVRPRAVVFLQQLVVIAGAVLACAVITPAWGQVVTGVLLLLTAVLLSWWSGQRVWPVGRDGYRGLDPVLGVLVLVAAAAAVWYAAEMIHEARAGTPDDDTWGLMHLPMQAAFGLALAGSAAVTWLAAATAGTSAAVEWRLSAVPTAVSACWLGVVSVVYPDHLGSLGQVAGVAAIVWGLLFAAAAMIRGRSAKVTYGGQ